MTLWLAMVEPLLSPTSRTFWLGWVVSAGLVLILHLVGWKIQGASQSVRAFAHPSTRLDVQLLLSRQLLRYLGILPTLGGGFWLAHTLVRGLNSLAQPQLQAPAPVVTALYTVVLFVVWDGSRYVLHRWLHTSPTLWAFHQVHHSAEVLTPLTFHRLHPLESVLYQIRGVLVTAPVAALFFWLFQRNAVPLQLAGVHVLGLFFSVVFGNLRHSHIWLSFGWLERYSISPAQHQIHHSLEGSNSNYGTWLSVWDRLGGSIEYATTPPERFGVEAANHRHDLLSAWVGPLRALFAAVLLVVGPQALGEPLDEEETVIVYEDDGTVRAAGSAHRIDEEELERFEYNDIGRVLAATPGVYLRGEDGYGLRPNIGLRGANSDRSAKVSVLEDGVPLVPAPYAAPAAYYFPMSTRLVGVEIYKGPASIQQGPQTVGGAINLLTREVPQHTTGALDVAYGLRNTAKAHGWVGVGDRQRGVLVEGVMLRTDGFKELPNGANTGFLRGDVMLKGRVSTDPTLTVRHELQLKLGWGSEVSHETYLGLHIDDEQRNPTLRYPASERGEMRWGRTQAELTWKARLSPALRLQTTIYHHYLSRSWTKFNRFRASVSVHDLLQGPDRGQAGSFLAILRGEQDTVTPEQDLLIGTNARTFHAFGLTSRLRWRVKTAHLDSQLEVGARFHGDVVDRRHTEAPFRMRSGSLVPADLPTATTFDGHTTATAIAVYALEDLQLGAVHLLPGVRSETVRTTHEVVGAQSTGPILRSTLLPGAAALVEWGEAQVFAGVHRGFSPVSPASPPQTKPELSWNTEVGLRHGRGDTKLELIAYWNEYENLTGQCTLSGGCTDGQLDAQFNGGRARVFGAELGFSHNLLLPAKLQVPISTTGTFTQSSFETAFVSGFPQFGTVAVGDELPYVPKIQGALRIALVHPLFSIGMSLSGRSGMRDSAGSGPLQPTDVPGRVLLDLAASAVLNDDLSVYTTVTNLTNSHALESWRPFGARPTAPIQWMVGIKAHP